MVREASGYTEWIYKVYGFLRLVLITDTQVRLYANECHPLAVGASCVFPLVRLSVLRTCLEFFWIPSDSVKIHAYFIRLTSFKILLSLLIWSGSKCLFKIHIYWQICNYYRLKTNVSEALLKTLKAKVPMFWAVVIRAASDVTSLKKRGSVFQVGYKVSMLDKVPVLPGNLGFNTQSKQGNTKKIMSDTVSIWRQ